MACLAHASRVERHGQAQTAPPAVRPWSSESLTRKFQPLRGMPPRHSSPRIAEDPALGLVPQCAWTCPCTCHARFPGPSARSSLSPGSVHVCPDAVALFVNVDIPSSKLAADACLVATPRLDSRSESAESSIRLHTYAQLEREFAGPLPLRARLAALSFFESHLPSCTLACHPTSLGGSACRRGFEWVRTLHLVSDSKF